MKNNRLEVRKTNTMLNKKDSNLNFKQALSKRYSKKSNIASKLDKDKPLKSNKKLNSNKSREFIKNQIKPFLTKNEIKIKTKQKNTEKIKNLLKHVNNNNLSKNNSNLYNRNQLKNKSSTNLCAPNPATGLKTVTKLKKNENIESDKSSKLNEFIKDNNIQEFNNNQNILKTNLAFLIAKNQNYDDDSVFLNINESYLDYMNNLQQIEPKRVNSNNLDKNKNELLSDDLSIKNNNADNNDTSSLINSIININKYLTNEVNHKAINNTNSLIENKNKKTKPRRVYENQLSKLPYLKDLNKSKEESKNNENDINANNIKNNKDNNNNNNKNDNYQKEIINKVKRSKYNYTTNKSLKAKLMKKRKVLNLEELNDDNNFINEFSYFNTHSPKMSINNKIIKNFQISPKDFNINKTLFNIDSSLFNKYNEKNNKERIKVSKAKKYKIRNSNVKNDIKEKSTKSNNKNNTSSSNKTNSYKNNKKENNDNNNNDNKKINEFNLINENVNNLIINNINNINNNIENNNLNNNIFDDAFFDRERKSQLNKNNYVTNFSNKKNNKKRYAHNSSCNFISPSLNNYNKYNTLLSQERNKNINISYIEQNNNGYLYTEDENNNSKIQEIKIKLKNPSNLNSPQSNKNKYSKRINIINPNLNELKENNSNKKYNNIVFEVNKNRGISSIVRNKNKSYIYSSKTPSYRENININKSYEKNEKNNLNNSNDKIINNQIYIKQIFSSNSKYNIQNNFLKLKEKINKNKIDDKNIEQLLKTESNKYNQNSKNNNRNDLNINMMQSVNNINTHDIQYFNMKNKNIFNSNIYENKNNLIQNNFYTSDNFFHTSNNNIGINKNSSPKIYIKPGKFPFKKNMNSTKILNFSPAGTPDPNYSPQNKNNSYLQQEDKIQISYRNNKFLNELKDKDNYIKDIEFINNDSTQNKINQNVNLYEINKLKTKAYVKKNNNIKSNKNNNNKLIIKSKVCNNNNNRIIKYYNFTMKINKQIIKKPCYISKNKKKPKFIPKCRRSFMTKLIYKNIKKVNNEICYIDKKVIKNENNSSENKEVKINLPQETNIIKANILDFSLDQNKIYDNNIIHKRRNYGRNKNYQESVEEINLSFSNDEINTFKYRESTIEAVFNELNNINMINNDSEIKVTFGCQENINSNYDMSTEGRVIKDSFFDNNKNQKIYKRDEILKNSKNKDKISSVIIYDNEEENEDILIDLDSNKKNNDEVEEKYLYKKDINDNIPSNMKLNKENENECLNKEDKENKEDNHMLVNEDKLNQKNKKEITSKDVINFAEKLGNIFYKKKNYLKERKYETFKDINIFRSDFNIFENKITNIDNNEIFKEIIPKWRTYSPKMNKYLQILRDKDLTPLNKLELRMNIEKKDFKQTSNNSSNINSINEIESENDEHNVTFNRNKLIDFQEINPENENVLQDKIGIKKEILYLLNIVAIDNINEIINKLSNIIINKNDIVENNVNMKSEYIFTDIIIKKSISEMKYSFLYSILCNNLYCTLLKNDKYLYNSENNLKNIIIISLDKEFEKCINNNKFNNKLKCNISGIINFIADLIYVRMIKIEKGFDYLNILYNIYINKSDDENNNFILETIIFLLNNLQYINYCRNDINNKEKLINFVNEKINILIENKNNSLEIKKFLINKNINEWNLDLYKEYKLNIYKNIKLLNEYDSNIEENNEDQYIINNNNSEKRIKMIDYYYMNNNEYEIILIIKNELINYTIYNEINNDLYQELISKYKISIYTIIKYYIEICIDYVDKEYLINNCNKYINNIIENYSIKNNKNEDDNNEIINLILNIDYIIMDNKNMYQIMGYLLYSLINYEIYKIEDLNKFIGKEEQTLINISIVIKYIIIYCNKDYIGDDYKAKILEEFKQTELFKNNPKLFDKYVTNELLL